jgi:hypothetical protein
LLQSAAMPEPFAIAMGVIGLSMSTFSFFVATVQKTDQFRRDHAKANKALRAAHIQLVMAKIDYKAWKETWCNGPRAFTEADYVYFWGREGYDEVLRVINEMQSSMAELARLLYSSEDFSPPAQATGLTEQQIEVWQRELRNLHSSFDPQKNWLQRIASALTKTAQLTSCVHDLKDWTSSLAELSREKIWDVHFQTDIQPTITNKHLTQMLDRRDLVSRHSKALTQLYDLVLSRQWGLWAVVLRSPDPNGGPESLDSGSVLVNFLAPREGENATDTCVLEFFPSQYRTSIAEIESAKVAIDDWYSKAIREAPSTMETKHMYLMDMYRFRSDLDERLRLTRAAISLTNWSVLLWDTPWTRSICSCCIQFVSTARETEDKSKLVATISAKVRCEKDRSDHLSRKALLLGTSLAEIAIRQQLDVRMPSDGKPTFRLAGAWISAKELLEMVGRERDLPYERAVRYCFWYDEECRRQAREFHPDDIIRFKEQVMDE